MNTVFRSKMYKRRGWAFRALLDIHRKVSCFKGEILEYSIKEEPLGPLKLERIFYAEVIHKPKQKKRKEL